MSGTRVTCTDVDTGESESTVIKRLAIQRHDGDTRLRAMGRLQSRFTLSDAAFRAVIAGTPCE